MTNHNTIITRYMSLEKFLDLIINKRFYFPSLATLREGDPVEGEISDFTELFLDGRAKQFDHFINKSFPAVMNNDASLRSKANQELRESKKGSTYLVPFENICTKNNYAEFKENKSKIDHAYYVLCWHLGFHESSLMWKVYGSSTTTLRIKSTVEKLNELLMKKTLDLKLQLDSRAIQYFNFRPEPEEKKSSLPYQKFEDDRCRLFYKDQMYESEKEHRFVLFDKNVKFEDEMKKRQVVDLNVEDLNYVLDEIRVSPGTPQGIIDLLKNMLDVVGVKKDVVRSRVDKIIKN